MILETSLTKEIGKLDAQITAVRIDLKILELQKELLIDPGNTAAKDALNGLTKLKEDKG